ncbi:pantoate-beta-alanine ligase [Sorochytrium milnesiophthora]
MSTAAAATVDVEVPEGIQLLTTVDAVREFRRQATRDGQTVGFVPTMGALHDGHLELVHEAARHSNAVVASIFVNPAQFAPHEDLSKYPRTLGNDLALLASRTPCRAVFVPTSEMLYPAGIPLDVREQRGAFVEVLGKSHQMEGQVRPHFFRGVATVVSKLFNIVQPDVAVFGQKDAQQCCVVRTLIRDLHFPIRMVVAATRREADGLAMSSRNRYLDATQRQHVAPVLYRGLQRAHEAYTKSGERRRSEIVRLVEDSVRSVQASGQAQLEYVSVADVDTLAEVTDTIGDSGALLSAAMRVGTTRLIDNVTLGCEL